MYIGGKPQTFLMFFSLAMCIKKSSALPWLIIEINSSSCFAILARSKPEESARLLELADRDIIRRYRFYQQLAEMDRDAASEAAVSDGSSDGNRADTPQAKKEVKA